MANPIKGEAEFTTSDGRKFTLVMDMEALVEAEASYGKPLAITMQEAAIGFVGAQRALLYGSFRAHHPEVSLQQALQIFMEDKALATDALERATQLAYADLPGTEDKQSKNAIRQPGENYGRNGAKSGSKKKGSGGKRQAPST